MAQTPKQTLTYTSILIELSLEGKATRYPGNDPENI